MPSIIGVGIAVPKKFVTNKDIEAMNNGVNAAWTAERLNIHSRYICENETIVDLATKAASNALVDAKLDIDEIDLIIVGTATPYKQAPSTACYVQEALGAIDRIPAFDMTAVCASFIYALTNATDLMACGKYRNILVIGADTLSKYTDWSNRNCVFFGDGAGAVVLSSTTEGILASTWQADGSGAEAWTIENHQFWRMDGPWVYSLAVDHITQNVTKCLAIADMTADEIDHIIPHQPGIGVLRDAAKNLGVDFGKVHTIMNKYSNTSSACIPIALRDALDNDKIKNGDVVLLTGVGAGWTSASVLMRWHAKL